VTVSRAQPNELHRAYRGVSSMGGLSSYHMVSMIIAGNAFRGFLYNVELVLVLHVHGLVVVDIELPLWRSVLLVEETGIPQKYINRKSLTDFIT